MSTLDFFLIEESPREFSRIDLHKPTRPITVNIRNHSYNHINPSPVKISKDSEILEEFLSPRKLQALTGVNDLHTVEYLEMRVNTEQMSLGNFGMYLPNLSQIKLSGSYIPAVRDLGTSLTSLQVLWMPQCSLQSLDGLVTMCNLKELYLEYNEIEDISACGMLEQLEILDLEGNMVADLTMIHYLSMCPTLCRLTLEGNPLSNPNNYVLPQTYRKHIFEIISHLQFLDDLSPSFEEEQSKRDIQETFGDPRDNANATLEFDEHWNFINTILLESGLLEGTTKGNQQDSILNQSFDESGRPTSSNYTNSSRPITSMRPLSAQRQLTTSCVIRPQSSSSQRLDTANTVDSGHDTDDHHEDSSLTAGRVVCGSITKSLRRKSTENNQESLRDLLSQEMSTSRMSDRGSILTESNDGSNVEDSCDIVLKELEEWRRDYERSKTRIEVQRVPQVLTIDYSDDDIEEVNISLKQSHPRTGRRLGERSKVSKKIKDKPEIKLNPVRNGKLPLKELPSSWIPRDPKIRHFSLSTFSPVTPPSSESVPQMSRIRRQLIQSGVSSIMPSKLIFKK